MKPWQSLKSAASSIESPPHLVGFRKPARSLKSFLVQARLIWFIPGVKYYFHQIFESLQVSRRAESLLAAQKLGWIEQKAPLAVQWGLPPIG